MPHVGVALREGGSDIRGFPSKDQQRTIGGLGQRTRQYDFPVMVSLAGLPQMFITKGRPPFGKIVHDFIKEGVVAHAILPAEDWGNCN